jgi:hypothetical protein
LAEPITNALIGAAGTVVAALITWLLSEKMKDRASSRYRKSFRIADILGGWKCVWYFEDGSLYNSDDVTIERWVKDGRFIGRGVQPNLSYVLEGEIDGAGFMVLTYRTLTKAYVGVACLRLNMDHNKLAGHWYGRAKDDAFTGGKTEWSRA